MMRIEMMMMIENSNQNNYFDFFKKSKICFLIAPHSLNSKKKSKHLKIKLVEINVQNRFLRSS